MQKFLIICTVFVVFAGGFVAYKSYDQQLGSNATQMKQKVNAEAFDLWQKMPWVDANGNKLKPITN